MSSIDGKFASAPGLKAAFAYRPSPPLRAGDPIRPPKNGKGAQDDTARQKIFAQAIWDLAVQSNNKRFPARFVLDDEGKVYFDQGCIDMARDWLDCDYAKSGWPLSLQIKPEAWAAGRPPTPGAS